MATFDVTLICNMALDRCHIGQHIEDIGDSNHRAQACNQWYPICRDRVLAAFQWPFATLQVTLGLVQTDPNDDWKYSYRYPNNCILARRICTPGLPELTPVPFVMGQDNTGRLIFTDQEDAILEMTAAFTDPGEWPDVLADAISALLASEIARPLRAAAGVSAEALQLYDRALLRAQGIAAAENRWKPKPRSRYIQVRGALPILLPTELPPLTPS